MNHNDRNHNEDNQVEDVSKSAGSLSDNVHRQTFFDPQADDNWHRRI